MTAAERLIYTTWYRGVYEDFTLHPMDFQVDPFLGTTYFRRIAPPAVIDGQFNIIDYGGDDVRRITRDTAGRVLQIEHGLDASSAPDSVIYHYDALGRIDSMYRSTLRLPNPTNAVLDTMTFTWDTSATITATGARCNRLRTMHDAMGGVTMVNYGSTSGSAGQCLPTQTIGLAQDTTKFFYGALTVGDKAGARPVKVVDANGLADSAAYDATTWNTGTHIRVADGATSRAYYGIFGWIDSTVAADTTPTMLRYDQSGRVIRAKTGRGLTAPTVVTHRNRQGLVDSTRVYSSNGVDGSPIGTVQNTTNAFDRLGGLDTTVTPGGRIRHFQLDPGEVPFWDYGGNGSYVTYVRDWQERPMAIVLGRVDPSFSADGQTFGDTKTDSVYGTFGLGAGSDPALSQGVQYDLQYDNKGGVKSEDGIELATATMFYHRSRVFMSSEAPILETTTLTDGGGPTVTVARTFQYNRRGQRTVAASNVTLSSGSVTEPQDTIYYFNDSLNARLDSLTARVDSSNVWITYSRVRWTYDRGGRETRRVVVLGGMSDSLVTTTSYDNVGRVSAVQTSKPTGTFARTWYSLASPQYDSADQLKSYTATTPGSTGGEPVTFLTHTHTLGYSTDGARRLMHSSEQSGATYDWTYDVFGNRLTEDGTVTTDTTTCGGAPHDTSTYASDNALVRTRQNSSCNTVQHFLYDHSGNRLALLDSTAIGGQYVRTPSVMTYTALHLLRYAVTPQSKPGNYDYNWHRYDALGMRIETIVYSTTNFLSSTAPPDSLGTRNFYVYDGADVALVVQKTGATWGVAQRFVTGGIDQQLASRVIPLSGAAHENVALVSDVQGSTLSTVLPSGAQESNANYYARGPFGQSEVAASGGAGSMGTGFTGASTPNQGGGFIYLRNRWYDPQTGRFLTQDPMSLAGGVNLYAYAGNDPVSFDDAFGLCATAGIDHVYDVCGREILSIPNRLDHDRYYLAYNDHIYTLDYPLVSSNTPYRVHIDPRDAINLARELAGTAKIYRGEIEIGLHSREGHDLDFKKELPDRELWAISAGRLGHKHIVGNIAWGRYMALRGISEDEALKGASRQGWVAGIVRGNTSGEDPLDQIMIMRGYAIH